MIIYKIQNLYMYFIYSFILSFSRVRLDMHTSLNQRFQFAYLGNCVFEFFLADFGSLLCFCYRRRF